ncbi:MAG: prephenate dehydrogenase/arogenate dehydrogenase family protein [Candidatus Saccharibacteria bacterium]
MTTLGIIGQGNFGKFIASEMEGVFKIETYDVSDSDSQFQRVAECDHIVLAIPLEAYQVVLPKLAATISPKSIIVDVCSVKLRPLELTTKYLSGNDVLSIHPLFGPSTTPNGIAGQKVVIIRDTGSFQLHADAQKFFEKLRLVVIQMDADKHDRGMAELHALTYYVAGALSDFGVSERPISTPSYDKLVSLVNLFSTHSQALVDTIEQGNPYAAQMRTKLMQSFANMDARYQEKDQS